MDLNPQRRIPDHLDTVLPCGRTVRETVNARQWERRHPQVADEREDLGWLAFLFGRTAR